MVSFLEPEKIIEQIPLSQDWQTAEFGCGPGGFAIALARRVPKGMVYALDIQEEPLSALIGRAKGVGLSNIKTIQCDLEEPKGSTLKDESMDLVLIANALFQIEDKDAFLKEAKRVLKRNGNLVIIDWNPDSPFGPEENRVSLEQAHKIVKFMDIKLVKELETGTYHWGAIFVKM
ncbi:class I SAM-dependent methyltransferase [Patescibacteria group bacterium]|nr:class I SAM-dependent methyltransferase [Patescibacteria group bacterium]MBU4162279.1 class I SAM-dependent methyltransferase [Patescibacteria group bacterium]